MKQLFRRFPRLATNYLILSGTELFSKVLAAIAFASLARVLGPESYGHLEFVLAIVFIFTLVVDSGLSSLGAREIAKDSDSYLQLVRHVIFARFVLAIVTFIILLIIAAFINQPPSVKRLLLLYSLTIFGLPGLVQWVFQGRDLMQYVALASLLRWSIFAAGVFLTVTDSTRLWVIPLVEGVAIAVVVIFLISTMFRSFGAPRGKLDYAYTFLIFRKALPIGASELVWAVKVYFATITLAFAVAGSELGWFSAAHRIVISIHAFVWLYFYNMLPSIARSSRQPIVALQKLMHRSTQVTTWSVVLLGIFGTAFAHVVIELLYGPQYDEAVNAFRILIWLIPLAMMSGHFRYTLIGYDKQQFEFLGAVGGAVVNVSLNLLLIPPFGFLGAAWALVVSEAAIWGITYYFVRRNVAHIPIFSQLWKPLIGGLVLIGTLHFLLPVNAWIAGSTALLAYGIVLLIFQPDILSNLRSMYIRDQAV